MKTIILIVGVILALLTLGVAVYLAFQSTLVDHAFPLAVLIIVSVVLIGYGAHSE